MLLTWSRRRRVYERWTNWYTEGVTEPTWGEATYESSTTNKPTSSNVGGHDINTVTYTNSQASSMKRKKQTITYDCIYLKFDVPSHAVTRATIKLYFSPQSYSDTLRASRLTAAIPSAGYPSITSTHRATATIPVSGGWVELDVTNIVNDYVEAGVNYGVWLDTPSVWTSRKNVIDFVNGLELGGDINTNVKASVSVNGVMKKVTSAKILVNGVWKKVKGLKKL